MIEPGTPAPEFTLRDQDDVERSLSEFRGRKVVFAFYPGDWSSVCGDQLSLYQEVLGEIESRGAQLIGVSVDSTDSHAAFREARGLRFPLLSDFLPRGAVADAYGAFIPERGHSNRSLVLIDEQGTVQWSYESHPLKVPGANLIFDALADTA
ncbi:MAG: redoxin domain-containing protein [Solirubrobacterales bacterium]